MSILRFLSPGGHASVASPADVRVRLLALNRPSAPYRIVDGSPDGVDLVAEWRLADATWYEVFARAGLSRVFRILLDLDATAHEVRAVDREYALSWCAGVPRLSPATSALRGHAQSIDLGRAYAFTETTAPGEVHRYRFDTKEMTKPIQDVAARCGWTYRGVPSGRQ